jgi:hypothetical protein
LAPLRALTATAVELVREPKMKMVTAATSATIIKPCSRVKPVRPRRSATLTRSAWGRGSRRNQSWQLGRQPFQPLAHASGAALTGVHMSHCVYRMSTTLLPLLRKIMTGVSSFWINSTQ